MDNKDKRHLEKLIEALEELNERKRILVSRFIYIKTLLLSEGKESIDDYQWNKKNEEDEKF